jgi:hypothetical protein
MVVLRSFTLSLCALGLACGRTDFALLQPPDVAPGIDAPPDATPLLCLPQTLPANGVISGTTNMMTSPVVGSCSPAVGYASSYTLAIPTGASTVRVYSDSSTTATSNNNDVSLRTGCAAGDTELGCNTDDGPGDGTFLEVSTNNANAMTLLVTTNGAGGSFTGLVQYGMAQGAACDMNGPRVCGPPGSCVAGVCRPATCQPLLQTVTLTGVEIVLSADTTAMSNQHRGTCAPGHEGGAAAPEAIIELVLPVAVTSLTASTVGGASPYDTLIYLRDSCLGTELACNDDATTATLQSEFATGPLPAGTYYLFIDGFDGRKGAFTVTISAS